jgi:hypothetical protein
MTLSGGRRRRPRAYTPDRAGVDGARRETVMAITRKTFLIQLAGGGWLIAGCGGGGGSSDDDSPPPAGTCAASISGNHGHTLTIPAADLDSTTDKTYDITGGALHSHSVTFTTAQLALLKAGSTVAVTSTLSEGHDHQISERCA